MRCMAPEPPIDIEVVYALPAEQAGVALSVPAGTTVQAAIALSGLAERYPEIGDAKVGIHGRVVTRGTVLRDADRVEIYRPLVADPKTARRRRAARAR
jgi:putative ubiquitin-RnfH superfamily antitoxin RatB of RatAB toxin-antitoxin module